MHKRICSFQNQAIACMVESMLRDVGFHPEPVALAGHISVAGAEQWYYLRVPVDEITAAREYLTDTGYESSLSAESIVPPGNPMVFSLIITRVIHVFMLAMAVIIIYNLI